MALSSTSVVPLTASFTQLAPVRAEMARDAGSDLVLYRAGEPEALVAAQGAGWDPVLSAEEIMGAFAERYVSLVQLVLERPGSVPTTLQVRR